MGGGLDGGGGGHERLLVVFPFGTILGKMGILAVKFPEREILR
jgi:hypothetical protein